MRFTGTSTIQSRGEKKPVRKLWILAAWTGSDTPWPTSIRSLVAYANWVNNRQRTSAFTWSGKTSRRRSVPSSTMAIRVGNHVPWCFVRRASWLPPLSVPLTDSTNLFNILSFSLMAVNVADGFPDSPLPVHLIRGSLSWNIIASVSYQSPGSVCWEGC